jgi:hypothetical protein
MDLMREPNEHFDIKERGVHVLDAGELVVDPIRGVGKVRKSEAQVMDGYKSDRS